MLDAATLVSHENICTFLPNCMKA